MRDWIVLLAAFLIVLSPAILASRLNLDATDPDESGPQHTN